MSKQEANANFYCPITQELMRDPVVDRDGNTFERTAIEEWLLRHGESPITRNPMAASDLIPNRSLRASIEDYINGAIVVTEVPSAAAEEKHSNSKMDTECVIFEPPKVALIGRQNSASEFTYMVSIQSPDPPIMKRLPATVVCVVDTSGSMCSEASVQGVESTGLSMLDIVKHAVRTVITTLQDDDRFGLVKFSTRGSVVCDLTFMTEAGKALALSRVDELKTGGSTNLWDGLKEGMDLLGRCGDSAGNSALFLLTDGVPSEVPPRGHLPMMQRYRDSNGGNYPGTISTFGFGYALDSTLLSEMAVEGGGMYAFIPDSGFVGTAFVNALGNHLCGYGKQCVLSVETDRGTELVEGPVLGSPDSAISSWGIAFKVPSLLSGTSQDFMFQVRSSTPDGPRVEVSLAYDHLYGSPAKRGSVVKENRQLTLPSSDHLALSFDATSSPEVILNSLWFEVHRLRLSLVSLLKEIIYELKGSANGTPKPQHTLVINSLISDCDNTLDRVKSVAGVLGRQHAGSIKDISSRVSGIKDDLKGQISEAISKEEWYTRWGMHYLPSLQRAHLLEQCNNFKDPGIQGYGGALFKHFRDMADDVFMSLPPPTPSRTVYRNRGGASAPVSAPRAPVNMAAYNDVCGGCLHENSVVKMANGTDKPIKELRKGDIVYSCSDENRKADLCRVVCMVRTESKNGYANLVMLDSGLRITPWHPVRADDGQWQFPASLCRNRPLESIASSYVYTFVLEDVNTSKYGTSLVADKTECIALGHGIENDNVASHRYFGSNRVISDLQKICGWDDGLVTLKQECFQRDAETGQICGISDIEVSMHQTQTAVAHMV